MFGSGAAIGMEKATTVAVQVLIPRGQVAAVAVFCVAAVGTAIHGAVVYRPATSATLTLATPA